MMQPITNKETKDLEHVSDLTDALFPEYVDSTEYYNAENKTYPYVHLGNLCLMAFKDDENGIAQRLVQWTDTVFNDPESSAELVNLFTVEVLEKLVESGYGASLAKTYLHGKSLELLQSVMKEFATQEFLEEFEKAS